MEYSGPYHWSSIKNRLISDKYCVQVLENSATGSLIGRLGAEDADSGILGRLRYELQGFGSEQFTLNDTTGDLYVGPCALKTCLDYEEQDLYTFTCTAIDGGGFPFISSSIWYFFLFFYLLKLLIYYWFNKIIDLLFTSKFIYLIKLLIYCLLVNLFI